MDDQTTITPPPEWDSDEVKAGRRLAGSKLDAARQAVATLDGVVKWAAYEDADEGIGLVVTTWPALKALGNGRIGGNEARKAGGDATQMGIAKNGGELGWDLGRMVAPRRDVAGIGTVCRQRFGRGQTRVDARVELLPVGVHRDRVRG